MSDGRPAVLDALGEEFRRLGEPPAVGGLRRRGVMLAALLAVALAVGGVAAGAVLVGSGAPLPAPNPRDLAASGVPLAGTARLAGLDVPDPDPAEPVWDLRLSRTGDGETCLAVGQVLGGRFGIVGLDHVFRALPLGSVDACGVPAAHEPLLAGVRVFLGRTPGQARTVVDGVAGAGTRSVTVYGPGGARQLPLGPHGSFLAVYAGYLEEVSPRVVVVDGSGHSETLAFGQAAPFEVPDPEGRPGWSVSAGADVEAGAFPEENCAQASERLGRIVPDRFEAPLTPDVCGRLGAAPLFVSMRRFVPERSHVGTPWGNAPARTLVYGAADPRVTRLTLTGAGAPRTLAIDRQGGGFLAVLDGHVDPRSLKLTATLSGGRTIAYTHSTALYEGPHNTPIHEPPVPAYRGLLPRSQVLPVQDLPIASTVREELHAPDPAGGAEWVLRSWRGRPNPQAPFGNRRPSELVCEQLGVIEGGQLVQPPPAAPTKLTTTQETRAGLGGCNESAWLATHAPAAQMVSFVGDPYAYTPTPRETAIIGMAARDIKQLVLAGAGERLVLRPDANGAFLAVLPGGDWDAPLHIEGIAHGKRIKGYPLEPFNGPPALEIPQARAPDPDGGPPWGYAVAGSSSAVGQIVDGRLAAIEPSTGELNDTPDGWGGGECQPLGCEAHAPVQFEVDNQSGSAEASAETPLPPQIQRRTLPGRTTIAGRAAADVASVTLITPRDVRTLRPTGRAHALIVVYDGQFYSGTITARVTLRSGKTVTEQLRNPAAPEQPLRPEPSLSQMVARDRDELGRWSGPHAGAGKIAEGYELLAGSLRATEARLAYVRTHPGVLPR